MTNKITEMKDFDQLKQIIFKKLQEEIKEVNLFRLSGTFEAFEKQADKYNELFYFFYNGWDNYSDASEAIDNYGYTVEDIKKLMIKISTGLKTSYEDVKFLNKILNRRRKDLSFYKIFNVDDLTRRTDELQEKYNNVNPILRKLKHWRII